MFKILGFTKTKTPVGVFLFIGAIGWAHPGC
jgi:hypothetical protein